MPPGGSFKHAPSTAIPMRKGPELCLTTVGVMVNPSGRDQRAWPAKDRCSLKSLGWNSMQALRIPRASSETRPSARTNQVRPEHFARSAGAGAVLELEVLQLLTCGRRARKSSQFVEPEEGVVGSSIFPFRVFKGKERGQPPFWALLF